jgi:hypothetical protein
MLAPSSETSEKKALKTKALAKIDAGIAIAYEDFNASDIFSKFVFNLISLTKKIIRNTMIGYGKN